MRRWWDPAAILAVMFSTAQAMYTIHQEPSSFDGALGVCLTDGFLASMATEKDVQHLLSSVAASLKTAGSFEFWVGLRKPAGTCNREDLPLRGFMWTRSNSSDSAISRWRRTPVGTCTSELCGLLSLDFDGGKVKDWGWADSRCAKPHGFICKSGRGGTSSPPDTLEAGSPSPAASLTTSSSVITKIRDSTSEAGAPCSVGGTSCGGPQLPSEPPRPAPSRSPEKERIPTPSPAAGLTTSSSVISQIRDSTSDKYSIFIPVLVALLVLVLLVVVALVVVKCCFKKQPKKKASQTKNGKPEMTVDLTDTDLGQAETTA
ncbi:complement component C1q receptor-like [Conger conger]|uniref:complement component C1q receptor-like n=1 Tax=Conger conger TaxID=82655 RepID=UPI002A59D3B3|nr:complement component C1q receptor-like [Conger conger]